MPTASIIPTYYTVTWTGNAPTDYNALDLNQAGGLDNCTAEKYLRIVRAVGAQAAPTVAAADTIRINQVDITFTVAGGLDLLGIINTINQSQTETSVLAIESPATYVTLINAAGWEGYPIVVEDVTGGVVGAKLGLQVTTYRGAPIQQGLAMTLPLTNLDNVKINGQTITFLTGALNLAGVVATINASTILTGVSAKPAGVGIALISENNQPFTLSAGTTAGTWGNLGFTTGNKGGSVVAGVDNQTLAQSLDKERANMRWDAVVSELGWLISPFFLGEIMKTGDLNGTAPVTTLTFTVGYDRPSYLSVENSLVPNTYLTGTACIKRLIARALTQSYVGNQEIFDPTLSVGGNSCVRLNPLQILEITAAALDTPAHVATVEANISVVQINNV